ncbi:MAG: hypothetical protein M3146_10115 [Thermoproteota archaeon]|nr:hypothetical protein [Thermoproteota archaeon]
MGIDPGFGPSKFAVVITQFQNNTIQVIYVEEFERLNFRVMTDMILQLKERCGYVGNIYVDAANPEIWETLKREFGERYDRQYIKDQTAYCKKFGLSIEDQMFVVPVPFSIEGAQMLQHCKSLLENENNIVAINPKFGKLITSLRTAVANEYRLDKEATSYDDLFDAFRLSMLFYRLGKDC